jgi:hypothetical protein
MSGQGEKFAEFREKREKLAFRSNEGSLERQKPLTGRGESGPFLPARRHYFGILDARISISTNQPSTTRSAISTTERTGFMGFSSVPKNCW